jgi:hypothetical protein
MQTKSSTVKTLVLLLMFQASVFSHWQDIRDNAPIQGWRLDNAIFSSYTANQYLNVTYEGDLVISNNQTYTIENQDFHIIGKITVKDTSSLIIRNSNFTTVPSDDVSIELTDHANLVVTNATVVFKRPSFESRIVVQDNAKANITNSKLQNQGYVITYKSSFIYVNNSTIKTSTTATDYLKLSGVATFDTSSAEVENSTIDGLFVWGNSTASANGSVIGILRCGSLEEPDKTTVNITNSKVAYIETFGGAPTLYVEDSTVGNVLLNVRAVARFRSTSVDQISAYGNAFALLIESSAGSIKTEDNATVLVGWQLPLFGVVTLPYGWIPIVQLSLVVVVITIIVIALLVLRRRRATHALKEESQTKPTNGS